MKTYHTQSATAYRRLSFAFLLVTIICIAVFHLNGSSRRQQAKTAYKNAKETVAAMDKQAEDCPYFTAMSLYGLDPNMDNKAKLAKAVGQDPIDREWKIPDGNGGLTGTDIFTFAKVRSDISSSLLGLEMRANGTFPDPGHDMLGIFLYLWLAVALFYAAISASMFTKRLSVTKEEDDRFWVWHETGDGTFFNHIDHGKYDRLISISRSNGPLGSLLGYHTLTLTFANGGVCHEIQVYAHDKDTKDLVDIAGGLDI